MCNSSFLINHASLYVIYATTKVVHAHTVEKEKCVLYNTANSKNNLGGTDMKSNKHIEYKSILKRLPSTALLMLCIAMLTDCAPNPTQEFVTRQL